MEVFELFFNWEADTFRWDVPEEADENSFVCEFGIAFGEVPRETKGLCEVLDITFIVLISGIFIGKSEYIEVVFYLGYRENTI